MTIPPIGLTDDDRVRYEWQMWISGFGDDGQKRLKAATAFVSRIGGVGGAAALYLAAAGVGRLILAHGGALRASDLNRQTLMTQEGIGLPRIDCAVPRLREFNPSIEITGIPENVSEDNAAGLMAGADIIIDAAPLFQERFSMNRQAVRMGKPMIECAVYEWDVHLTTILPGKTACLACLYPTEPAHWRRQFPVVGAVAGIAGTLAAAEAIKILTGLGNTSSGMLLNLDVGTMRFRRLKTHRDPACAVCGKPGLKAELNIQ